MSVRGKPLRLQSILFFLVLLPLVLGGRLAFGESCNTPSDCHGTGNPFTDKCYTPYCTGFYDTKSGVTTKSCTYGKKSVKTPCEADGNAATCGACLETGLYGFACVENAANCPPATTPQNPGKSCTVAVDCLTGNPHTDECYNTYCKLGGGLVGKPGSGTCAYEQKPVNTECNADKNTATCGKCVDTVIYGYACVDNATNCSSTSTPPPPSGGLTLPGGGSMTAPAGNTLPQVCKDPPLEIGLPKDLPPDFWEQLKAPETSGRYVAPKDLLRFLFNRNVDPSFFQNNVTITGSVPKDKDGRWIPCTSPEPKDVGTHQVKFTVLNYLGDKKQIGIYHAGGHNVENDPFILNCKYTLKLKQGVYSPDGACLSQDIEHTFQITPDTLTPFRRETTDVEYDLPTGEVRSFRIKPNVTVKPDEMWRRYQDVIGWRYGWPPTDKIVLPPKTSQVENPRDILGKLGEQSIEYRQEYKGIPVEGGGFIVHTKDGFVRSVIGHFVQNLDLDTTATISEAAALKSAKTIIGAPQYTEEPKGELVIVSDESSKDAKSFRLAWRFELTSLQPLVSEQIDIDAKDPSKPPLGRYPLIWHSYQPTVEDTELDPIEDVVGNGFPLYDSLGNAPRTDFTVGRYKDQEEAEYVMLLNYKNIPPLLTLYENEFGQLQPIYDYKSSDGKFSFNGAAGKPPGQIAGVSVYWATTKAIEYVNKLFGETSSIFPPVASLVLIVSNNPNRFTGDEAAFMMLKCNSIIGKPTTISKPCLYFNLNMSSDVKAPVAPDVVGHELYHLITLYFSPSMKWVKMTSAPVLEGLAYFFGKELEFFIRGDKATWILGKDVDPTSLGFYNLAKPEDSPVQGVPSTYEGELYNQIDANCPPEKKECGVGKKSTLVGHAFYLMIYGQPQGTLNDLGCSAAVTPLDPDPAVAMKKAGLLFWRITSTYMGTYEAFGFYSLRNASMLAALEPYGGEDYTGTDYPAEVKTVQDAWYAVGVGNPSDSRKLFRVPYYGEKKVEPWPAMVGVTLLPDALTQQLQISTNVDFDKNVDKDVQEMDLPAKTGLFPVTDTDGKPHSVNAQVLYLKPSSHYFWRYRESPADPKQLWGKCHPISHFWTTSKVPELTNPPPAAWGSDNIIKLASDDSFKWSEVKGATKYFYRIFDQPEDHNCDVTDPPGKWAGYVDSPALDPHGSKLDLLPDTTYYLYLKSIAVDDKKNEVEGECSNEGHGIPFQMLKILSPVLLSPKSGATVPYDPNTPTTFQWGSVKGAVRYEIYAVTRDAAGKPGSWYQAKTASVPAPKGDPDKITGKILGLPLSQNGYCWAARAILPDERKGEWADAMCYNIQLPPHAPTIISPSAIYPASYDSTGTYNQNFAWKPPDGLKPTDPQKDGYHIKIYDPGSSSPKYEHDFFLSQLMNANGSWGVLIAGVDNNHDGGCWSVHAFIGSQHGEESTLACYTTYPNKPTILSPTGTGIASGTITFQWKDDNAPLGYAFTLTGSATASGYPAHVVNAEVQNFSVNGVPPGGSFTWTITALSPDPQSTGQSASAHFSTEAPPKPAASPPKTTTNPTCGNIGAPTNLSPAGSMGTSPQFLSDYGLSWSPVTGATQYSVQLYVVTDYTIFTTQQVTSFVTSGTSESLTPGRGVYQWGVKAWDSCNNKWGPEARSMYFYFQ